MDAKNQKNSNEFMASQPLKKMIPQLLLSVSLFSFVFSYSSLYSSSSLMYSPKFHYFSANSFQLFSHALNKNCLFLICNGLLVFLAKTSGLIRPPSDHNLNDVLQKRLGDSLQTALDKYALDEIAHETKDDEEEGKEKSSESPKEVSIVIAESEEEGEARDLEDEEKDENTADSRSCWLFDDDERQLYEEEAEEEDDEYEYEYEDDDDEEEEKKEDMSTEELNQKFEDFIRKMKEEIMINEARQKVVMVK